jgi:secondary thiamine-phosphate synthase enzyme
VESIEIEIATGADLVTDITDALETFAAGRGDGLCHVFVPHATAGVALIETGSGSEEDLAAVLDTLAPRNAAYRHRHGSPGHGRDHVVPAFIAPSIVVPLVGGRPTLGTWQRLVVVDTNQDNPTRRVRFSVVG